MRGRPIVSAPRASSDAGHGTLTLAVALTEARRYHAGPFRGMVAASVAFLTLACWESPPVFRKDARTFRTPDAFVSSYWDRPIPLQGAPPDSFAPLEASLHPSDCGTCHPAQYADWRTSIHAHSYSPGLSGQLVNWEESHYSTVRSCLACHAPLSEQSAQVPDTSGRLVGNPFFVRDLQGEGLVCAACHVRGWRRYGPPRRDGSLDPSPVGAPHSGVTRTPFFEDSRFCAGCHQFAQPAPNGKSLQNTVVEWGRSRYAEEGVICQTCHMPDRRHLWRGIQDSAMVADGVTIEWVRSMPGGSATLGLRVTNTGTGHRFPTYVTPKVRVEIALLNAGRQAIQGTTVDGLIGREVSAESGAWVEHWDTRLAPDSSLTVRVSPASEARFARGRVTVFPDGFYNALFSKMLAGSLTDTSRALITAAHRRTLESVYSIFDSIVALRSPSEATGSGPARSLARPGRMN